MTLKLSPQELGVLALFLAKAQRSLVDLRAIYGPRDAPARPDHALTAIIRSINRKLKVARKGSIVRVSPRGRGYAGIYRYKRR